MYHTILQGIVLGLLVALASACSSSGPYIADTYKDWESIPPPPTAELSYQVFLLGDAGGSDEPSLLLQTLPDILNEAGEDAAIIFLGDNIYCCGLPDSSSQDRPKAETRLRNQLDAVKDFEGRIVFVPGNHDWNHSKTGGLQALARQEKFVEEYLDRGNTFRPDKGFPGPDEVKLTNRIRLVVLDTEWWLTQDERGEGEYEDFDIENEGDFLLALHEVIQDNDDESVLVVGHHPLFSNGEHAGHFPFKTHIFPLTEKWKNAYIPLPVIGSLAPLFIRYFGTRQDLAHRDYRALRNGLSRAFGEHESLIYAAGHEHNFQYFKGPFHDYIVSGGGSRPQYVARGGKAAFTFSGLGFSKLNYYEDGAIWLETWTIDEESPQGKLVFRTQLDGPARDAIDPELPDTMTVDSYPDYSDSTYVIAANPNYQAGDVYKFFMGRQNRDIWEIPIEVPYLDMGRDAGGLTPIKRGGGMQTFSLRLQGADGYQYSLRSVDKDPSVSIPEAFRGTVATEIVQDQIASIHPYGAYIIPKLAEAAGIFYTLPRLVYVPDDPRLGIYREVFGNQLMMFELRPDDDMSDFSNFGRSTNVVSADKFYEEITDDNDNRTDVEAFIRARLFDMVLSDWDRHRLQWRWAEFETEEGHLYKPIPRDRDWAFNRFNGVFPWLMRVGFDPKFQEFDYEFGNIKGLTMNGLWQDRRLTAGATEDMWVSIAEDIQRRLKDDIIEESILDWPEPIIGYHGDEVIAKLKSRRDFLPEVAREYYKLLAVHVDIVGSHKHERFVVKRLNNDETEVTVYKTSKKGEVRGELYKRTFYANETEELRLFGLDGNDSFEITGSAPLNIRIRAIGGEGEDSFVDESSLPNVSQFAYYYDTLAPNEVEAGPNSRVYRSTDPGINAYNQRAYRHNAKLPQVFFGRNDDDGIFVGGGMKFVKHGFRKLPFQSEQRIVGNVAFLTQAFNILYETRFVGALGRFDIETELNYRSPKNVRNFFGLGNESENIDEDRDFYQAQFSTSKLYAGILTTDNLGTEFSVGTHAYYVDLKDQFEQFSEQPGVSAESFRDQLFLGLNSELVINMTDDLINPKQGFIWENLAELNVGIENTDIVYAPISSSFSFFISPSLSPQVTIASRIGVEHRIGEFPFFNASTVGGRRSIRGWRSNRFAGRTSMFTNAELRVKLFNYSSYIALGEFGLLGFYDNGRVWTEADESPGRVWHQGYGGGIWFSIFNMYVVNASLGFSEEDHILDIKLGFLF